MRSNQHIILRASTRDAFETLVAAICLSGNRPFFEIYAPGGASFGDCADAVFAGAPRWTKYMRHFGAGVVVVDDVPAGWAPLAWPDLSPPPERTADDVARMEKSHQRTVALLAEIKAGRHIP
jgi:hypothetical protein